MKTKPTVADYTGRAASAACVLIALGALGIMRDHPTIAAWMDFGVVAITLARFVVRQ